jgi:hypothetical protein
LTHFRIARKTTTQTQKEATVTEERTAEEHVEWCKQRARIYLDAGDLPNAVSSMASDIMKHPGTAMDERNIGALIYVAMMRIVDGDVRGVREWVEGFR